MSRHLIIPFLIVAAWLLTATTAQAADCQFILGFATLRDLIGHEIVGECLENQRYAANGNAEQQTTGGLLVWRKADNWTAFTDGHRTWIAGPNGLQQRLNWQRFPWEPDYAPGGVSATPVPSSAPIPTPPPTAATAPTIDPILAHSYHVMRSTETGNEIADRFSQLGASLIFEDLGDSSGGWRSSPYRIVVNEKYRNDSPETLGLRLIWPTMWLHAYHEFGEVESWKDCMALETATKIVEIRYWSQMYGWKGKRNPAPDWETWANEWLNIYQEIGATDDEISKWIYMLDWVREFCEKYGEPEQHIDPDLADAYRTAMWGDDSGIGSAAVVKIVYSGADVRFGQLPANVYGRYSSSHNLITINESLRGYPTATAATLIHETHHAFTATERGFEWFETAADCLQDEINAFRIEARWWYEQYGRYGKRNPSRIERHYNGLLYAWLNDGMKEWVLLSEGYQEQCLGGVLNRYGD